MASIPFKSDLTFSLGAKIKGLPAASSSGEALTHDQLGTTANKIIQLNALAQLPAVDGSLLTGIGGGGTSTVTQADILRRVTFRG